MSNEIKIDKNTMEDFLKYLRLYRDFGNVSTKGTKHPIAIMIIGHIKEIFRKLFYTEMENVTEIKYKIPLEGFADDESSPKRTACLTKMEYETFFLDISTTTPLILDSDEVVCTLFNPYMPGVSVMVPTSWITDSDYETIKENISFVTTKETELEDGRVVGVSSEVSLDDVKAEKISKLEMALSSVAEKIDYLTREIETLKNPSQS